MTAAQPPSSSAPDAWATIEAETRVAERLRAGEEAAFDELVAASGGRLLAVARRMMHREEDAQDAVQDAFLSAVKAIDRFDGRSRLTTWLHRICVNACLMKLRTQRRRPESSITELLPRFLDDGHQEVPSRPWQPEPESGIEAEELRALVRSKINDLPEGYREVLMLRDIEGLDTEETARMLETTAAAVKTRLHRARQALRTLLDPCMAGGSL
jgi:RNA polymerase sigma-70 factor (ECF subfamily)